MILYPIISYATVVGLLYIGSQFPNELGITISPIMIESLSLLPFRIAPNFLGDYFLNSYFPNYFPLTFFQPSSFNQPGSFIYSLTSISPVIFLPVYLIGLHSLHSATPRSFSTPTNTDTLFLNQVDQVVNASSSYGFNQFLLSTINSFSDYLNNYIASFKPLSNTFNISHFSKTPLSNRLINLKGVFNKDSGLYSYNNSILSRKDINLSNSLYHPNLLPSHKIPMSPISTLNTHCIQLRKELDTALQSKYEEILDLKIKLTNTEAALLDSNTNLMKTEASLARHMDITTGYNNKLKSLKSLFDNMQEGYNTKEIEVRVLKHTLSEKVQQLKALQADSDTLNAIKRVFIQSDLDLISQSELLIEVTKLIS